MATTSCFLNFSTQVEIDRKSGREIHWTSPCSYILKCTKIINSDIEGLVGKEIKVQILKTAKNKYTYSSSMDNKEMSFELKKI